MAIKETCLEYLNSSKGKCCGCGSCFNICPTKAISMVYNSYGFLEPSIDEAKCVHCGICKNACPIFNHVEKKINNNTVTPKRYVFSGSTDVLSKSSSGGAFTYIANKVLNDGGCVVGAAYDDDFSVHHVIVNDDKDLDRLRISKYAQSDQSDCYAQVKKLLNNSKTVLYTGTPCQIAGLKSFLRNKDYSNLYTVDLLCHGIPSYKLLCEYLETNFGMSNISEICMRKKNGWSSCLDVTLKDDTVKENNGQSSMYMHAFLKDIILRESCYGCKFASLPRYGDITIGDCWNARKLNFKEPFSKKSSIVLINNDKGHELWTSSVDKIPTISMQDISSIDIKLLNANIYKPNSKRTHRVDTFWENYKTMNFTESYLKTLWGDNPIGLVLYASNNYGSCATNLALYLAIENLGFTPVILDSFAPIKGVSKTYLSKHCKTCKNFIKNNDIELVNRIFSTFVVGSDYSFNINASQTRNSFEYLSMAFVQNDKNKIAYAPSLGLPDFEHDESLKFLFKYLLKRFNYLSFREDSAVEHVKKHLNLESKVVLDPVFLIDKDIYISVANKSSLNISSEYILVYMLDPTPQKIELVQKYENLYGLKKFVILDIAKYEKNLNSFQSDVLGKLSFEDFIYYFINAKFIITDSFHGTCFSLIFNKNFISIKNRNKKRFDTLQNMFKNEVSFIPIYDSTAEASNADIYNKNLDYVRIGSILDKCCLESNFLLKKALISEIDKDNFENDSVEMNMQYVKLWRSYYNAQKQLKELERTSVSNDTLLSGGSFDNLWKTLSSKIMRVVPPFLQASNIYSKYFYKIFIKGINPKIHYEFLIKDNKPYFCFHCEDKNAEEYCKPVFENIRRLWNIESPKSLYKLNIPIQDITFFDIEAYDYIGKSLPLIEELLKIEQLKG